MTPKCLFSRDVISGSHAVTRLRSCHYGFVVMSLKILRPIPGAITCDSDTDQHTCTSMLIFKFQRLRPLKEQSRPSVSNITSADVRLTTPFNSATSLVNVMNFV